MEPAKSRVRQRTRHAASSEATAYVCARATEREKKRKGRDWRSERRGERRVTAGARVRRAVHGVNGVSSEWQTRMNLAVHGRRIQSGNAIQSSRISHGILRKRRNARA